MNLALAFFVAGLVVALIGEDPFRALSVMVAGAFVYDGGLGYTLYYTTNFIFTGLAVAVAFQAQLFNIGGEGQAYLGGLGAILVCLALDAVLPGLLLIPLAIAGAALLGAAWAAIPGYLQAWRGSHVVITTIMFNFIAAGLMVSLLAGPLQRVGQSSPQTREIGESAQLPFLHDIWRGLGFEATTTPLNLSFPLALLACLGVWLMIWRTRWGYALRALGASEPAAEYAGIPVRRMILVAMLISGALAGCMAVNEILGAQHKMVLNFTAGYGFTGIAVALMGRTHPVGIILASLLFGALYQGGSELDFEFRTITREMVLMIQGLIILFSGALALMFVPWLSRRLAR
ncbi:MAG: ABC transporter permease [Pseudomonadota bacterium]